MRVSVSPFVVKSEAIKPQDVRHLYDPGHKTIFYTRVRPNHSSSCSFGILTWVSSDSKMHVIVCSKILGVSI